MCTTDETINKIVSKSAKRILIALAFDTDNNCKYFNIDNNNFKGIPLEVPRIYLNKLNRNIKIFFYEFWNNFYFCNKWKNGSIHSLHITNWNAQIKVLIIHFKINKNTKCKTLFISYKLKKISFIH